MTFNYTQTKVIKLPEREAASPGKVAMFKKSRSKDLVYLERAMRTDATKSVRYFASALLTFIAAYDLDNMKSIANDAMRRIGSTDRVINILKPS